MAETTDTLTAEEESDLEALVVLAAKSGGHLREELGRFVQRMLDTLDPGQARKSE